MGVTTWTEMQDLLKRHGYTYGRDAAQNALTGYLLALKVPPGKAVCKGCYGTDWACECRRKLSGRLTHGHK